MTANGSLSKNYFKVSENRLFINFQRYQSKYLNVPSCFLDSLTVCVCSAGLKVRNFQLRTEPIRLFNISNY